MNVNFNFTAHFLFVQFGIRMWHTGNANAALHIRTKKKNGRNFSKIIYCNRQQLQNDFIELTRTTQKQI